MPWAGLGGAHWALQTRGLNTADAHLPWARRSESSVQLSEGWVPPAGSGAAWPGFRGGQPWRAAVPGVLGHTCVTPMSSVIPGVAWCPPRVSCQGAGLVLGRRDRWGALCDSHRLR